MSMFQVTEGAAVNFILPVFLMDANGNGVGGVTFGDVTARYKREGAVSTAISVVAAGAEGTWQSGGWIACAGMGAGNYELHVPLAVFVTGAGYALIEVSAVGAITQRYVLEIGPFEVTLPDRMGLLAIDANGRVTANSDQIAGNASAATKLAQSADKLIVGNALTVSATQMTANIAVTGNLNGSTVVWANGARAEVTSYSYSGGVGTFGYSTLSVVPSGTSAFVVV